MIRCCVGFPVLNQLWMHDRLNARLTTGMQGIFPRQEEILSVNKSDGRLIPQLPANRVVTDVAFRIKQILPVLRPLAIDVTLAWLAGASSRKINCVCMIYKIRDQRNTERGGLRSDWR